jgi:predicted SAM-dependent methyltransferase
VLIGRITGRIQGLAKWPHPAGRIATRGLRGRTDLRLNVGDGGGNIAGWVTLDIEPSAGDGYLDAGKTWPLDDGCAVAVRSEQMLEHLTWEEAALCVRETFRVLAPGGLCRICTPDLEGISRVYLARNDSVLEAHRRHGYFAPTWAHIPNNYLRMWGHAFVHDFDSLAFLLDDAGFTNIERTMFGESRHDVLSGTDSHDLHPISEIGLYVDAVRPATKTQ